MPYSLLSKAIQFAVEKHDGEFRDGDCGLPYSTHPIEVCSLLRYVGGVTDVELLCVACLHDVLEETDTLSKEIDIEFGLRISLLVSELTRTEPSVAEAGVLSRDELWEYRSNLLLADIVAMSPDAQMVKLADRLANLRQAKVTRKGEKLRRYERQSKKILEIIPKSVNPSLWKAIAGELA
jgi:GTP diphosphokinase / guanosine-3',5'-bis(diphosphate) 3'-diphosphatase